jgi:hypothetical protein
VAQLNNIVSSISCFRKAISRIRFFALAVLPAVPLHFAQAFSGATVPWTTYEAENMTISNGTVLGPQYGTNVVASESSGRKCVQLDATGEYVQFTNQSPANAIVVRYSVPDTNGTGTNYTLSLYTNGLFAKKLQLTSKYSWLYGTYGTGSPAWTNNPAASKPRNFYDEVRTNGLTLNPGVVVQLRKDSDDTATNYVIDLVDLENVASLTQPANSLSITNSPYNAVGDGSNDCTKALQQCINDAAGSKTVWIPPGIYKITNSISLPSFTTIQGAGMWYSTLVGDPALYNTVPANRVTLNGAGNNIHLYDFAIVGKLNYRNDSEPNDGLGGSFGTGSTIARVWVEHTKTGAWLVNSKGLVVDSCRFRNTLADGINLCVGMQSTIVTNCTARGTGDDCFAIWPATYNSQTYSPGSNVITHCTAQTPFLANGGAIYGGTGNRIEDCLFQDTTYGCGILISTTFPVGANTFSGTTVAQRCDLNRCGGCDPNGYQWRAAFQLCLDWTNSGIPGLNLNNLNITDSISDGLSVIGGTGTGATGTLAGAVASYVNITNYGLGPGGRNGLWARSDALGSMTISNSTIIQYKDDAPGFSFTFVTSNIPVTVQASPSGRSFTVDGTPYSTAQVFSWLYGSSHTIATTSPQSGGAGIQYVWDSWSDSNAISHAVTANSITTHTANFTTQYYLTMNAGAGGSVTPGSGWTNSGAVVDISATASNGYNFMSWTGSGSGSYSGNNSAASVTMNGPIAETAAFALIPTRILSLSGDLAFGNVAVGASSNRTMTIGNAGNSDLTVSNISYPDGFSGAWSGVISAGGSTNLNVSFAPLLAAGYSGNLAVNSDATSGSNTLGVSGFGVLPPPQQITGVSINANNWVTLTYATTPGFVYHLEVTTNLFPAIWTTVPGSATNAAGSSVTFTDPNLMSGSQRYYRTVSP